MTPEVRAALNTDAILHPAPDVGALKLRPFSHAALALCSELKLTFFTLEMLVGVDLSDQAALNDAIQRAGAGEVNRQCHILLYMLGCDPLETMLASIYRSDLYRAFVLPWMFTLDPDDAGLVPRLLAEWVRFMTHYAAAQVKVLPKEGGDDPGAPGNS